MNVALLCHSLRSCWNHGNAHFLRGIASALLARGHRVTVFEPRDSWSRVNLAREQGEAALDSYRTSYPELHSIVYDPAAFDLEEALDDQQLVLVHEWNTPELVAQVGALRAKSRGFRLLFHDTHHRAATAPDEMARFELTHYDGVLAFGEVIQSLYLDRGWAARAWVWHEGADTRRFRPLTSTRPRPGMVWIGNWGDDERTQELNEFLIDPAYQAQIPICIHGVRYPAWTLKHFRELGIDFSGWLPNHRVPEVFAQFRFTVHVPRRPYAAALPGIPTIRVFEALACGIPLISGPWQDCEGLFRVGADFLMARDGREMARLMRDVMNDDQLARALADSGRQTILARHTCDHRVDELLDIAAALGLDTRTTIGSARPEVSPDLQDVIDFYP